MRADSRVRPYHIRQCHRGKGGSPASFGSVLTAPTWLKSRLHVTIFSPTRHSRSGKLLDVLWPLHEVGPYLVRLWRRIRRARVGVARAHHDGPPCRGCSVFQDGGDSDWADGRSGLVRPRADFAPEGTGT